MYTVYVAVHVCKYMFLMLCRERKREYNNKCYLYLYDMNFGAFGVAAVIILRFYLLLLLFYGSR